MIVATSMSAAPHFRGAIGSEIHRVSLRVGQIGSWLERVRKKQARINNKVLLGLFTDPLRGCRCTDHESLATDLLLKVLHQHQVAAGFVELRE